MNTHVTALDRLDALIKASEQPGNSTWLCQCTADLRSIRAELVRLNKKDLSQLWLPCFTGEVTVRPSHNHAARNER